MSHPSPDDLRLMAQKLAALTGRFHPGRPAYFALSRAEQAVLTAVWEVEKASDYMNAQRPSAE